MINGISLRDVYRNNMQISDLQILRKLRLQYPGNPLIGYLRINSLRNKIIDIREMAGRLQLDYFVMSETKLDSSFPSAQFHIGDYEIWNRGGGLIEFVKKGIILKDLTISKKISAGQSALK